MCSGIPSSSLWTGSHRPAILGFLEDVAPKGCGRKGTNMKLGRFTAAAAAVLLCFGACMLVACGPSAEEVIRNGIVQELDKFKNHDPELMAQMEEASGVDELASFGIDAHTFMETYLDGFDYRIDEVKADGDTATATIALTCKSFSEYQTALEAASASLAEDDSVANLSEEELSTLLGQTVMDSLIAAPVVETEPFDVTYERIDGVWSETAEGLQAIEKAMFGN